MTNTNIEKKTLGKRINLNVSLKYLNNKKILITGSNGFIASSFIRILSELMDEKKYNIKFYGIVRKNSSIVNPFLHKLIKTKKLTIFKVDINKEINITIKPDICFHTASITSPEEYFAKPIETLLTPSLGTINLLNFCKKKKIKKFIFLSSGEIYGNLKTTRKIKYFDEEKYGIIDPGKINSNYGISKKFCENILLCWSKANNLSVNSIRLFHTYGPNMKLNDGRIHSDLVGNVVNNKNLTIKGDPNTMRSFCYITDVINGIITVIIKGKNRESYNLANPKEMYRVIEIAKIIKKLQKNKNLKIIKKKNKNFNKRLNFFYPQPSIRKLNKLGWTPKVNIKTGLTNTLSFFNNKKVFISELY